MINAKIGLSAIGQEQTIPGAGQPPRVHHNPPLSGDFQPLTLGRMWESRQVAE
jgi:hypothetical protein